MADVKVFGDKEMDKQTDGQVDRPKTICRHLSIWHKKEKLLVKSNFSFSHGVFYPFGELSATFIKFGLVVCKLFQFGSLKFVVWKFLRLRAFKDNNSTLTQLR